MGQVFDVKLHQKSMRTSRIDRCEPRYAGTEFINRVCAKLKTGKSTGPDRIPNEIVKQEGIQILLLSFINVCFQYSIIPSIWNQADISPIPNSTTKDQYAPLITVVSVWYLVCINCTQVL